MFQKKAIPQTNQAQDYNRDVIARLAVLERRLRDTQTLEATRGYNDAVSAYLLLPDLRGFWAMTSVDEAGDVYDYSGQGRKITNQSSTPFATENYITYSSHDASADYFERADEAGLDITGGLTIGCWVRFDTLPSGTERGIFSKWLAQSDNRSYRLFNQTNGTLNFNVCSDGTSGGNVGIPAAIPSLSTWYFIAGRYTPSTSLRFYLGDTVYENTTSIPASIFSSGAGLYVGAYKNASGTALIHDGDITFAFLCASALSDKIITNLFHVTRPLFGV